MPSHTESPSTDKAARASPKASHHPHLVLVAPEQPTSIPSYPSFRDRLQATDTWSGPVASAGQRTSSVPPPARLPRSPSSSLSSLAPSLSPPPRTTSSLSPANDHSTRSSSARPSSKRARSRSSASSGSSGTGKHHALRTAQAAAVRRAVQQGKLDANTYTDGQLYAVKESAARAFGGGSGGGGGDGSSANEEGRGKKRQRRGSGVGGRAGHVFKEVQVKRASCAVDGEGSEAEAEAEAEQVEVDLGKMLGL